MVAVAKRKLDAEQLTLRPGDAPPRGFPLLQAHSMGPPAGVRHSPRRRPGARRRRFWRSGRARAVGRPAAINSHLRVQDITSGGLKVNG